VLFLLAVAVIVYPILRERRLAREANA
jgi:hypothetical protein